MSGLLIAAGTIGLGYIQTGRFEQRVETFRIACVEQGQRMAKDLGNSFILDCDPTELAASSSAHVGVQNDIAVTQRRLWAWKQWPAPIAVVIGGVLAMPWSWHFLLRRVRELRDAIIGR